MSILPLSTNCKYTFNNTTEHHFLYGHIRIYSLNQFGMMQCNVSAEYNNFDSKDDDKNVEIVDVTNSKKSACVESTTGGNTLQTSLMVLKLPKSFCKGHKVVNI